jgi:hypothetical protein
MNDTDLLDYCVLFISLLKIIAFIDLIQLRIRNIRN